MRDLFTKNVRLKLISLVLAVSLEIYFVSPHNSVTATLRVVVDITNLPLRTMIISPAKARDGLISTFKIRGPAPLVEEALSAPRRLSIVLPPNVGESFVTVLNAQELRLPSGIEVLEIDPPRIELRLEKIVEKDIPVRVVQIGEPPIGMLLDEIRVQPEIVHVRGASSLVSGLETADTERIDLATVSASQVVDLPLMDLGDTVDYQPESVHVEIRVSQKLGERTMENIRVRLRDANGYAATIEPSRVKVVLSGAPEILQTLQEKDIDLMANGSSLTKGSHEVSLTANLPPGARLLRTIPETVTVNLIRNK